MSQGLCPSCGAAVNLTAGQTETKCQYCQTVGTFQQAEAQYSEVKTSKLGGTLMLAEMARESGNYEEAGNYYNKIIEQDPTYADAWFYKGVCILQKRLEDRNVWWNHVDSHVYRGEAVSAWKMAIKLAKHPEHMQKRVAAEINNEVEAALNGPSYYTQLTEQLLSLETILSFALELDPRSEAIAKTGIALSDHLKPGGGPDPWSHLRWAPSASDLAKLQSVKNKYLQTLKVIDPAYHSPPAIPPSCLPLPDRVTRLIFEGRKIAAIKELRTIQAGLGLTEAKDIIEKAESDLRAACPGRGRAISFL